MFLAKLYHILYLPFLARQNLIGQVCPILEACQAIPSRPWFPVKREAPHSGRRVANGLFLSRSTMTTLGKSGQ
jgi:hypothetical protein